jgi:hypothetical protein
MMMSTLKLWLLLMQAEMNDDDDIILMEDDIPVIPRIFGGSHTGKAPNVDRRRVFYSHLLYQDFWGNAPV